MFWKTVWRWRCKAGFLSKLSGKTWSPFIFCLIIPNFEVPCLSRGAKILTITRRDSFQVVSYLKESLRETTAFVRQIQIARNEIFITQLQRDRCSERWRLFFCVPPNSFASDMLHYAFFSPLQVNPIQEEGEETRTVPPTPTGSDRMFRRTCNTSDANFHHVSLLFVWACPARRSANNLFWKQ